MNVSILKKELNRVGMKITLFEFSAAGYGIEIKLIPTKAFGWEELETLPIGGLEIAKTKQINEYRKQFAVIPCNQNEFRDYIKRYKAKYELNEAVALEDLECIIENYGSITAKQNFQEFLSQITRRRKTA